MMIAVTEAQILASLATIGAGWSLYWNAAAARRVVNRAFKITFALSAAFSAVFVVAWAALAAFPDLDRSVWSEAVTPFSLVSFFVVWSGPPLLHFFQHPQQIQGGVDQEEVPPP